MARESELKESEFFIFSDSVNDSVACDPVKTRLLGLETEAKEPTNTRPGIKHCDWFILPLLLPTPAI